MKICGCGGTKFNKDGFCLKCGFKWINGKGYISKGENIK